MRWIKQQFRKIHETRILPWFLCLTLFISGIPFTSTYSETLRYAVVSPTVNVRNAISQTADIVFVIKEAGKYLIVSENKDSEGRLWYKIKINDSVQGFIASWVVDSVIKQETETPVSGKKAVLDPGVKIRLQPSLDAEIDQIVNSTVEKVILAEIKDNENRTWYRIQLNSGKMGWVASWVVKVKSTTSENEVKESANLRNGPGTNFEKIAEVTAGKTFQLLGSAFNANKDTWYAIQIEGKNGWIFGQLVTIVNPKEIDVSKIGTKITLNAANTAAYSGPSNQFTRKDIPKKDIEFTIIGVAVNHTAEAWFQVKQANAEDCWVLQQSQNQGNIPAKPIQKITALSWSKKQQGIELSLGFEELNSIEYDSFQLTNPTQLVVDIKNTVLFKKEHFELINYAGIINLRATQYSVNPHIVRIVMETSKEFQLIQRIDQKTAYFELTDFASYQGPKLIVNGQEIENHLSLKESKGVLQIPLYVFSNMVNGLLTWDKDKNEAVLQLGKKEYRFQQDAKHVLVSSSTGQEKVIIPSPISVIGDVMYFPYNGLEAVFKVKTYSMSNHYYIDNQLLEMTVSEGEKNPVIKCSFSLPIIVNKKTTDGLAVFSFLNTALGSSFQPPSMDFIDKILSLKRTNTTQSSVEVNLLTNDYPTVDTANLEEEFIYVLTLRKLKSKGLPGKKIILDAGHGAFSEENYYDTGAIGPTGLLESVVNLKVVLSLKAKLEKAGATVVLTRDQEQNKEALTLEQRITMANKSGADLYISIHQNASINQEAKGSEVYYYNEDSSDFADKMLKSLISYTGLTSRGTKKRGFAVTKEVTTMPSILMECAFISNPEEERMLQSEKFIELITDGLLKGLQTYFE